MDKVLQSIKDSQDNKVAKDLEILDWYKTTDLKKLRKEWNYKQVELATLLGINSKTFNAVEAKYSFRGNITNNIEKLYNFYQNEFNKKVVLDNKQDKVLIWYKNTNLKALREQKGYTQAQLCRLLRINAQTLSGIEKHRNKGVSAKIKKLYEFYNNNSDIITPKPVIVDEPTRTDIIVNDIPKAEIKPVIDDEIVIRIDKNGNVVYSEMGNVIQNITELHLDKVGDEKPILSIKLERKF